MRPELSVIVPVFNEEAVLPQLFDRLYTALDAMRISYEILFVDDGSTDRSAALLREQYHRRPESTRVILLARNAGQHPAILEAFERAHGSLIITIDADLQNAPEDIPLVHASLQQGYDYVGTLRQGRHDPWWRRAASRTLNRIRARTTHIDISDQGCMLRGYSRSVVDAVNRCGEVAAFVPALAYACAARPTEIAVSHADRAAGRSKYSLLKLIRLNFDLMTGYSILPLQICSFAGVIIAAGSLCFVLYLVWRRLMIGPEAEGVFTLFAVMFFLIGVLLLGLGIVGEYVGRIYQQVRQRPRCVVASVLESPVE